MPRSIPIRPLKLLGNVFVLIVSCVIATIYYTYVFVVFGPQLEEKDISQERQAGILALLSFFHLFFIMLVWSFIQSMSTDPGQVPVFWGFHLGDPENKRRRYCLNCNIFKPERCHHCSTCKRCVLNMDHHCPWINNCVGFWNRKYFLLLLIYVLITTYFVGTSMMYDWIKSIQWSIDVGKTYKSMDKLDQKLLYRNILIQITYMFNAIIGILMTMFLKFHIALALGNTTTIENLEKKGVERKSVYDIGGKGNWEQIFGINRMLWPFPMFGGSGKPSGDGIYWPTNRGETDSQNKPGANSANRRQNSVGSPGAPGVQRNQRAGANAQTQGTASSGQPAGAGFPTTSFGGHMGNPNFTQQQLQQQQMQQRQHYSHQQNVPVQYQPGQHAPGGGAMQPNQRLAAMQQNQQQNAGNGAAVNQNLNQVIHQNNQRAAQLNQQLNRQRAAVQSNVSPGRSPKPTPPKQRAAPRASGAGAGGGPAANGQPQAKRQRQSNARGGIKM